MSLTSIGFQKTPSRPVEITFGAQGGLPNANQTIALLGHMSATGGSASGDPYAPVQIANVADPVLGAIEANAKFGAGSELAKMVIAAIKANSEQGNPNYPMLTAVPLAAGDSGYGDLNEAGIPAGLAVLDKFEAEFIVSPYDGATESLGKALETQAQKMSGSSRTQNGQYGTVAVIASQAADIDDLPKYDSQFVSPYYLRDTAEEKGLSLGELAAGVAAILGGNLIPFNPVDNTIVGAVPAPAQMKDWLTIGAGLESEAVLNRGWSPLRVKATGDVAIVRSVTSRLTTGDGVTQVGAYYDLQDFQVLYFFRKTVSARWNQPDFTNGKASADAAKRLRNEVVRLASAFEDQGMFQSVALLAPRIQVERNAQDRSRFDVFVPVNVVPGLHVIATNIQATTDGDVFTV